MVAAYRFHAEEVARSESWHARTASKNSFLRDRSQTSHERRFRNAEPNSSSSIELEPRAAYEPLRQPLGFVVAMLTVAMPLAWQLL